MNSRSTAIGIARGLAIAAGLFCLWWWLTGPLLQPYGPHDAVTPLDTLLWVLSRHVEIMALGGLLLVVGLWSVVRAVAARSVVGALLVGALGAVVGLLWLAGSLVALFVGSILGPVYLSPYGIGGALLLYAALDKRLPGLRRARLLLPSP